MNLPDKIEIEKSFIFIEDPNDSKLIVRSLSPEAEAINQLIDYLKEREVEVVDVNKILGDVVETARNREQL